MADNKKLIPLIVLVLVVVIYFVILWIGKLGDKKYEWPGDDEMPVVLWFHKKSCPYCVQMAGEYQAAKDAYKADVGKKLNFVDVDLEDIQKLPDEKKNRYLNIFSRTSGGTVPYICMSYKNQIIGFGDTTRDKKSFMDFFDFVANLKNGPRNSEMRDRRRVGNATDTSGQMPASLSNSDLPN
jgi:thiol-disulfide isomerase/thioredoxin